MLSMRLRGMVLAAALAGAYFGGTSFADTLEFADGRKLENCYVRDEGTRILVWRQLADVGQPPEAFPRSAVKSYQIERGPEWDRKPDLPDLSVTFIEVDPKNYSLHGRIQVDQFGRPLPAGGLKEPGHTRLHGTQQNHRGRPHQLSPRRGTDAYGPREERRLRPGRPVPLHLPGR